MKGGINHVWLRIIAAVSALIQLSASFSAPSTRPSSQQFLSGTSVSPTIRRNENDPDLHFTRRNVIETFGLVISATIFPQPAISAEDTGEPSVAFKKPYAPLEFLLPATRVRLYIDELVKTTERLDASSSSGDIKKISELLQEKQQFLSSEEESLAKRYLDQPTWDGWQRARDQEKQNRFLSDTPPPNPLKQLDSGAQQWGTRQQFLRLRRSQLSMEKANNMRAAFNAYTNNLAFGESYQLNVDKEEKSRMIRNDNLPDVTAVVRSDLDLRDLYRNQVLDYMDDARAELKYQLTRESLDASDLLDLLKSAQKSCSEWFQFIPEKDVQDALETVRRELRSS
jgi:hypothetical protein